MRERLLPLLILLTCIAALSLAAGGARAGDGALAAGFVPLPSAALPVPPAAMPALPVAPSVVAGLMAFIDPETGRLTGPIGQLQVPQDQLQSYVSLESLVPVTLPDGSVMLDLRGALQDYIVLQIDALGRTTVQCVDDLHDVTPFVNLPAPSPYAER